MLVEVTEVVLCCVKLCYVVLCSLALCCGEIVIAVFKYCMLV